MAVLDRQKRTLRSALKAHSLKRFLPGAALSVGIAIAVVAYFLGRSLPLIGGPVIAVVLGILVRPLIRRFEPFAAGVSFSTKSLLQVSIVLLGLNLSLVQVWRSGVSSLPVMLGTMAIVLLVAYPLGKILNIQPTLRSLIAIGTAICGASAIAATSMVLEASETDIAYAIATVFLFNILAVLIFPPLGHLMQMSERAFGLWSGTAINDTSSVAAAGFAYSPVAGNEAVIVKLTRATLIIPLVLGLVIRRTVRMHGTQGQLPWLQVIPWFILWFVVAAAVNSFGLLPASLHVLAGQAALLLIIVALAGVGLSAVFTKMRQTGAAPLLLGATLWILIAASSLLIAAVLHLPA